jgi:hypothetical protein
MANCYLVVVVCRMIWSDPAAGAIIRYPTFLQHYIWIICGERRETVGSISLSSLVSQAASAILQGGVVISGWEREGDKERQRDREYEERRGAQVLEYLSSSGRRKDFDTVRKEYGKHSVRISNIDLTWGMGMNFEFWRHITHIFKDLTIIPKASFGGQIQSPTSLLDPNKFFFLKPMPSMITRSLH